ncbi:phosphatase PAP2 family protein [uncultured Roseovarius sp.]|uniref:phosphatase PAP2 family protein n=1 Tax=uncultured Roseovarius sp. TaxID=293344 RepID=UPI0025990A15|nr:phosphatase PAP2 family protein [uncultured Roseovarius sp.]
MSATSFYNDQARTPRRFSRNRLLYLIVSLYILAVSAIGLMVGQPLFTQTMTGLLTMGLTLAPTFLLVLYIWHFFNLAVIIRPERPIQRFFGDMRAGVLDGDKILNGTLALIAMVFFFSTFNFAKDKITYFQPFVWDSYFADLDRILHFGRAPHEWLYPLFGTPLATTALNAAYHFWFFLMYFLVFMACYDRRSRAQSTAFLFAVVICFVFGGNILATLLSSAGPVYYQEMGFGTDYVPLMDMLYRFNEISPVWALHVQEMLLEAHHMGGAIKGISAMPSMHVATTVVMTCYLFTWRRWAGWLMVGFTTIIMIGSVHLAWHYAVDGYLAIPVALVSWWLGQKLTRLVTGTPEPGETA